MWNKPEQGQLPYPHQVVEVITPDGKEIDMYRIGNLWFPNGDTCYVYWTPVMWRYKRFSCTIEDFESEGDD